MARVRSGDKDQNTETNPERPTSYCQLLNLLKGCYIVAMKDLETGETRTVHPQPCNSLPKALNPN